MSEHEQFKTLLEYLLEAFADESDGKIELDLQAVARGSASFREELCSAGFGVTEIYQAHLLRFKDVVLRDPSSPHYLLKSATQAIARYLRCFEVTPNGPDALKYTMGLGYALSTFLEPMAEQQQVAALSRMRTLRVMRDLSAAEREDGTALSATMMKKLQRMWCQGSAEGRNAFGIYGTYMIFKSWSMPGVG